MRRPSLPLNTTAVRWTAAGLVVVLIAGVAAALAISTRSSYPEPTPSVDSLALGAAPAPLDRPDVVADFPEPASAAEALALFLQAEQEGRLEISYALLDRRAKRNYPLFESWVADKADRPRLLRVSDARPVGSPGAASSAQEIEVSVEQEPAVNPFVGFVAARTTQRWSVRSEGGRWRLQDRPSSDFPELPSDDVAAAAARSWVGHLSACRPAEALALQVEPKLYGVEGLSDSLCGAAAPSVGDVAPFEPDSGSTTGLSAFGPDIDLWARLVPVEARKPFLLVLAPLGDDWKILATIPADEGVG